jgi:predicted nuclease of predicted toxin-antitoxin system
MGRSAARVLRSAGHDVERIGEPGLSDAAVLELARSESRVLITEDKDFGAWIFHHGVPSPGVVRLVGFPVRRQGAVLAAVLKEHEADLLAGALVVVSDRGIRVRPPGIGG